MPAISTDAGGTFRAAILRGGDAIAYELRYDDLTARCDRRTSTSGSVA